MQTKFDHSGLRAIALSAAIVVACVPDTSAINIVLDFTLDDQNERWFNPETPDGAARRGIVESAATFLSNLIEDDDWAPISSYDGRFSVRNASAATLRDLDGVTVLGTPEPGGQGFSYTFGNANGPALAANEVLIHMHGLDFATQSVSNFSFPNGVARTPATSAGDEFSTWGGKITFNSTLLSDVGVDWYAGNNPGADPRDDYGWQRSDKSPTAEFVDDNWWFESDPRRLYWSGYDLFENGANFSAVNGLDLYQSASRALLQILGVRGDSIAALIDIDNEGRLIGENSVAEFGGPVPYAGNGRLELGVESTVYGSAGIVSEALTTTNLRTRMRRYLTDLDVALLRDLGFEVSDGTPFGNQTVTGDFNRDGTVDAADYTLWRDSLGTTGVAVYSGADASGDGQIAQDDYRIWENYFGSSLTNPSSSASSAVPEPSAVVVTLFALLGGVSWCGCRSLSI